MSRNVFPLSLSAALLAGTAMADVPKVAADITPVHSLVARVMDGVGDPALIVQQGASPHGYSLRPSEAEALQEADLVFWMGADLTPWMSDAIHTLTQDASVTSLLDADVTARLETRSGALFEAHDHGDHGHDDHGHDEHGHGDEHADHDHDHEHDDEHAQKDHDDHGHDDHGHDDHDHDDHDHDDHGHAHGAHDPHAWLSPDNAAAWLNVIAAELSAADPDNAGTYFANAKAGQQELAALSDEIDAILDPVRGKNFIVFHDAYQYFEASFDMSAAGAISLSDASDPSPARIEQIQARVADQNVTCVLAEPQFDRRIVETVMEGSDANTGVLDPLGSDLDLGPGFYPQLLRNLATSLADCLG